MIQIYKPHYWAEARRASENWMQVRDGHPLAFRIMQNHYSFKGKWDGYGNWITRRFVGPGERIVLLSRNYDALFVWRKFIDDSGQEGVNCAVFRNESQVLSSSLILEAEYWAAEKWGAVRVYTYVCPESITSKNPGYCFKVAGWIQCGTTKKNKLTILEKHL